jgi:hypothetical protein
LAKLPKAARNGGALAGGIGDEMDTNNTVTLVDSRVLKSGVSKSLELHTAPDGSKAAIVVTLGKRASGFDGCGHSYWRKDGKAAGLVGKALTEYVERHMAEQNKILAPIIAQKREQAVQAGMQPHGCRIAANGSKFTEILTMPKKLSKVKQAERLERQAARLRAEATAEANTVDV